MANLLVCTSKNVLLPASDSPQPATLVIDTVTGKIIDVQLGRTAKTSFPDNIQWVDADDKYVLPGLVE